MDYRRRYHRIENHVGAALWAGTHLCRGGQDVRERPAPRTGTAVPARPCARGIQVILTIKKSPALRGFELLHEAKDQWRGPAVFCPIACS